MAWNISYKYRLTLRPCNSRKTEQDSWEAARYDDKCSHIRVHAMHKEANQRKTSCIFFMYVVAVFLIFCSCFSVAVLLLLWPYGDSKYSSSAFANRYWSRDMFPARTTQPILPIKWKSACMWCGKQFELSGLCETHIVSVWYVRSGQCVQWRHQISIQRTIGSGELRRGVPARNLFYLVQVWPGGIFSNFI